MYNADKILPTPLANQMQFEITLHWTVFRKLGVPVVFPVQQGSQRLMKRLIAISKEVVLTFICVQK